MMYLKKYELLGLLKELYKLTPRFHAPRDSSSPQIRNRPQDIPIISSKRKTPRGSSKGFIKKENPTRII